MSKTQKYGWDTNTTQELELPSGATILVGPEPNAFALIETGLIDPETGEPTDWSTMINTIVALTVVEPKIAINGDDDGIKLGEIPAEDANFLIERAGQVLWGSPEVESFPDGDDGSSDSDDGQTVRDNAKPATKGKPKGSGAKRGASKQAS